MFAASLCAQPRLADLEVVLWPEYDRPGVLVILRATLAPDVPLPVMVEMPMPAVAGAPHAVAKQGPNGELLLAQHTVETEGEWSKVRLLTDVPGVRLEYYAPLPPGAQRKFTFTWPGGYEIDRLSYEVLNPAGASNMVVTPSADGVFQADGLTFYRAALGGLSPSESFTLELAYVKSSPELSSPAAPVVGTNTEPAAPVEPERPLAPVVLWAWIIAAVAIVVALVAVVVSTRRNQPPGG
jgi:hypothetical protein